MDFTPSIFQIPILIVTILSLIILAYLRDKGDIPGSKAFTLLIASLFVWSLFEAMVLGFNNKETMKFFDAMTYFGIAIAPPSWLVFSALYTGHDRFKDRRVLAAIFLVPLLTLCIVWSPYNSLIWETYDVRLYKGIVLSVKHYGVWFWVQTGYAYVMLVSGVGLLLNHTTFSTSLFIRQKVILVLGLILPWLGNAITLAQGSAHTVIDLTLVAFSFSCVAVLYGLFEYNLMDIIPLAQRSIFDNLSDAFLVIDARGKIVEFNTRAGDFYGGNAMSFGTRLEQYLGDHPALAATLSGLPETRSTVQVVEQVGNAHFETTITPLIHGGEYLGASVQTRDVSVRVNAEEKVQAYNHMLTLINKVLRHDISNNIAIAMLSLDAVEHDSPELMERARKSLQRSRELIVRMKEYEAALSGNIAPSFERLEDMIRDIASSYPQAGLSISGSSDILVVNSLYSVIENIIRNAIVHGGADHIEVTLDETPECSIIEISDNGAGMSKLALEHAFEEGFSYGKNKGTGIGLYLVRNLMDTIGGTIVLQNRYPHGVTAIIKIKKGKEA
jgi:PAS domain S-box-containing protein